MTRFITIKTSMSMMVIAVALAMVSMGTFALFSDTEESAGNTFGAGTLDLTINPDEPGWMPTHFENLYPGWANYTYDDDIWVRNNGSIGGNLTVTLTNPVNQDNGCNEPESDVDASCGNPGIGEGELGDFLHLRVWDDVPGDQGTINSLNGTVIDLGYLAPGESKLVFFDYWVDAAADNSIQSDGATFDLEFNITQA